jgi:hypothetical protein
MKESIRSNDRICFIAALMAAEIIDYHISCERIQVTPQEYAKLISGCIERKQHEFINLIIEENIKLNKDKVGKIAGNAGASQT